MKRLSTFLSFLALVLYGCTNTALDADLPNKGKGLSVIPLKGEVVDALKAKGQKIRIPGPKYKSGNPFNPGGQTIGQLSTSAEQKILVLFVDLATNPPGGPAVRTPLSYFDNMLFGTTYDPAEYASYPGHPTNRTLKNYYKEVSYGKINIVTLNLPSKVGWTKLNQPYDYYFKVFGDWNLDNGFGPFPANAQGLVIDAIKAVDSKIDFSKYAINGVVPNLFVVVAGTGAEWSGDPSLMWSHSWDLSDGTGLDGFWADGVKINNYAMMPEVGGNLTGFDGPANGPFPPTVGVYAHEYAHVLGLPDQYDYGYESEGTGAYSLMAAGSWTQHPCDLSDRTKTEIFAGNSPTHMDAWSKYRLGLVTPTNVTNPVSGVLPAVESSPVVYKMEVPNSGGKEYFLFENRQLKGFDLGLARYGAHGMAIYHVDETVLSRNYWYPNEAENWKEYRYTTGQKASNGETHYAISLIQADDRWDLEKGTSRAQNSDLYPGSLTVQKFGSKTFPNSSNYYFWNGSDPKYGFSGVTVTGINESSTGNVAATFSYE